MYMIRTCLEETVYVIRSYRTEAGFVTEVLFEMTVADFQKAEQSERVRHSKVSTDAAHRYVKNGGTHTTPLWVDDRGRIRRAVDNS
jgi:hypothetical protein